MADLITDASAGVVFLLKSEDGKTVAALQRRKAGIQSMGNGHQLSAHGKLTPEEFSFSTELRHRHACPRIIRDELGQALMEFFQSAVAANEDCVREVYREVNKKGREMAFFAFDTGLTVKEFEAMVTPGEKVAGFTMLSEATLPSIRQYKPEELRKYDPAATAENQTVAVPDGEIAMHADEQMALSLALSKTGL